MNMVLIHLCGILTTLREQQEGVQSKEGQGILEYKFFNCSGSAEALEGSVIQGRHGNIIAAERSEAATLNLRGPLLPPVRTY